MSGALSLGHGSGGRLTQQLTQRILSRFGEARFPSASRRPDFQADFQMEDCAFIDAGCGACGSEDDGGGKTAVSIDGFTVFPHDFPGGDIGKLAVCGSANDLAVRGAEPLFLALSLIIEEGLDVAVLDRYMDSAAQAAGEGRVALAAGDTKVVPRGAADKLFITTCAIGRRVSPHVLRTSNLRDGDALILSTAPGRHGAALAAARFGLDAPGLTSDCALLWPALSPLLRFSGLRCMRDCTRGGLGTVLCEWAEASPLGIEVYETSVPADTETAAVCDILGFDPLYLASEGCALAAVAPEQAEECLVALRESPLCRDAAVIGRMISEHPRMVGMRTRIGGMRFVDMPAGELLPRIC
ncbi:MAG: hydrogenase expression/formation protein HypE [Synergistaceae bacterium]|jgi:hydrogenase expression/formation protein HypE|nr:hydrogenase expression/formation protein HypE [Synergistaceae bacterium]